MKRAEFVLLWKVVRKRKFSEMMGDNTMRLSEAICAMAMLEKEGIALWRKNVISWALKSDSPESFIKSMTPKPKEAEAIIKDYHNEKAKVSAARAAKKQ